MQTLSKQIAKQKYYSLEAFEKDVKDYIQAIETGSMCCVIKSVSSSGMSRVLQFYSFNKYYRQYNSLLEVLGYKEAKNGGFKVSGCGMDMVFHTNYTIIRQLKSLGYINEANCKVLEQKTPTVL